MSVWITSLQGREILDSRGRPTVEAQVELSDGTVTVASVPSGASTGRHEAHERRDGNPERFGGLGVLGAVAAIDGEIATAIVGQAPELQGIDAMLVALDGTTNKSRLGANAILAVSLACARACAAIERRPLWESLADGHPVALPLPMVNMLSGGLHASQALDFQDVLAVPIGADSYRHALEIVCAIHRALGEILRDRGLTTLHADEGGYGPPLPDHEMALALLEDAIVRAGLEPGADVCIALDIAATQFFDETSGRYNLQSEGRSLTAAEFAAYLAQLLAAHPVISIEDPFAEDDWTTWSTFTHDHGARLQIVGDDLFTTNPRRLARGVSEHAANAVLVKMNQIGTISETLEVIRAAHAAGFSTVVSARSGETEDPALADLAVGCNSGQIKIGSVTQSDRLAKYNQLLRIEQQLGMRAQLAPFPHRRAQR